MSGRKKHNTANKYLRYLRRELSPEERHSLERDLQADPFESEAMEGLESITAGQAEEDLLMLHARLLKRRSRRRRIAWYSAAASVASLLIIGTIFLQIYDFNPLPGEETVTPGADEQTFAPSDQAEVMAEPETETTTPPGEGAGEESAGAVPTEDTQPEQIVHMEAEAVQEVDAAPLRREALPEPLQSEPIQVEPMQVEPMQAEAADISAGTRTNGQPEALQDVSEFRPVEGEDRAEATTEAREQKMAMPVAARPVAIQKNAITEGEMETQMFQILDSVKVEYFLESDTSLQDEVVVVGGPVLNDGVVQSAMPSGGWDAFREYAEKGIQFPETDTGTGRESVVLSFSITSRGRIRDLTALQSPGEPFTEEAIRLIREGPEWIPATDGSGNTDQVVFLRINFIR